MRRLRRSRQRLPMRLPSIRHRRSCGLDRPRSSSSRRVAQQRTRRKPQSRSRLSSVPPASLVPREPRRSDAVEIFDAARIRRRSATVSVVSFVPESFSGAERREFCSRIVQRCGTLACAPRCAAVLARAGGERFGWGMPPIPLRPQRWTVCDMWTLCGWRAVGMAAAFEQPTSPRARTCQDSRNLSGRESAECSAGPSRTRSPSRRVATHLTGGRACSERDPGARSEASTAGRAASWRDGGAAPSPHPQRWTVCDVRPEADVVFDVTEGRANMNEFTGDFRSRTGRFAAAARSQ